MRIHYIMHGSRACGTPAAIVGDDTNDAAEITCRDCLVQFGRQLQRDDDVAKDVTLFMLWTEHVSRDGSVTRHVSLFLNGDLLCTLETYAYGFNAILEATVNKYVAMGGALLTSWNGNRHREWMEENGIDSYNYQRITVGRKCDLLALTDEVF